MGYSVMREAMGIASWECSALTYLSFAQVFFFLVVRTVYYFSGSINVNHHLCGDSYSILVAPVDKPNIITHPGEKRK